MTNIPEWLSQLPAKRRTSLSIAALAASYVAAGWLGLLLTSQPSYASPVWPAAGVAVAGLMLFGRKLWPGVWIGSLIVSLVISGAQGISSIEILSSLAIATAASVQALVGAWLVHRRMGMPVSLSNFGDAAKLLVLVGPIACLICASTGVAVLWSAGSLADRAVPGSWLDWWGGEVLGTLLIVPIALFAPWREPKALWNGAPITPLTKSMVVGLFALLVATLAAWVVTKEIIYDRNLVAFSSMADDSEVALRHRIETYRQSLDGGAAVVDSLDHVTREDWLNYIDIIDIEKLPGINGIGFIEPVEKGAEAAFVQQSLADGVPPFEVHPQPSEDDLFVIKYIEPIEINMPAVGLDIGFEENRREAAEISRDTGEAQITKRITLVQDEKQTSGFLLLRPVYDRGVSLDTVAQRRAAMRGWVYAPFIASRFIQDLTSSQDELFSIYIYDGIRIDPAQQIFGQERRSDAAFTLSRVIPVEGQNWTVVWDSTKKFEGNVRTNEPFLVLGGGLALIFCFGGLLQSYARREADISNQVEQKTRSQEQALMALSESERRFGDLAGLSPAGIIRTDSSGFCIYANECWLKIVGLSPATSLGTGWISAIHHEDRAQFHRDWLDALDRQVEHRATFRFAHLDGTSRWADMITRPEKTEDGQVRGYIAVAMDVTEGMKMQTALQTARKRAEAAVEAKSSFLANMSHEIRTPMNGVIGFTELILASELTEEQRRQAQLIADSGRSMMRLLNDILDLSKADAGQMKISCEPLNLHNLMTSTITLMTALADKKGIELHCEIADDVPKMVASDALRIRQILLNLLGNALKFTSEGSVTLRAYLDTEALEKVVLSVEDTGIGIADNRQVAIFSEFVQADVTIARDHGGTGLGLAISRKLTQLLGGELKVTSELGKGSTFSVSLPIVPAEEDQIEDVDSPDSALDLRRAPRVPRCCRILLVEDHDINQILMKDMLSRLGMDVEVADNGAIALEIAKSSAASNSSFDLVLMDMNMPVMNGIDATRAIRAAGIDAFALPIVALTANAFDEDIKDCLEAGMQAHLTKPVNMQKLEESIQIWAKQSSDRLALIPSDAAERPVPPSLMNSYQRRKQDTIESVELLLQQGDFSKNRCEELAAKLHKLAGTAGMFGEAGLGECARELEAYLRNAEPENIHNRIGSALEALREAEMAG